MRVLLTGGAGFIGHHVAAKLLRETPWDLIFLDRLDLSGNLNRIAEIDGWNEKRSRCSWVWHDLRAPISDQVASQIGSVDVILHLAAGTHVDRSIEDPLSFVYDNVVATTNILDFARRSVGLWRFLYFSTDEVFGPAPVGVAYREWDRYNSGNPYAAAKAGGEEMALAFHNTYGVPVIITHTMNVIGERQHPEKFVPMTIAKVRDGRSVTIHADKTKTKPGSRFYIHAADVADAVMFVITHGTVGEKYNVVGERELDNLALAKLIAEHVGKALIYDLVDFHSSRPGHDLRYALDGSLLASMGWAPCQPIDVWIGQIVRWSLEHPKWLAPVTR